MQSLNPVFNLLGRILLGALFVLAGFGKIQDYAGTQGYMASVGVPGMLLPLVILVELGGGLAVITGWQARWAALALAGFSLLTAVLFHNNFGDQTQMVMFLKNAAIAGGMLLLVVNGPGGHSLGNK